MFTDPTRASIHDEMHRQSNKLFAHLLTPTLFFQAASLCGLQILRSPLNLVNLVWLALAAARDGRASFVALLTAPLKALEDHQTFPATDLGRFIAQAEADRPKPNHSSKRRRNKKRGPTPSRRPNNKPDHDPLGGSGFSATSGVG